MPVAMYSPEKRYLSSSHFVTLLQFDNPCHIQLYICMDKVNDLIFVDCSGVARGVHVGSCMHCLVV